MLFFFARRVTMKGVLTVSTSHVVYRCSMRFAGLDTEEENLIDLAADGFLPQNKVEAKLRDIERQRKHLTGRLDTAGADLTADARLIEAGLQLLENPYELYLRCTEQQRRLLNPGDLPSPLHQR